VRSMTLPVAALAEAVVDLGAIAFNARLLADHGAPARMMAVVKADAFGHGMVPAARACLGAGASWLGVTTVEEALQVRAAGIDAPLLTWLYGPWADFAALVAADVDVTAGSVGHLDAIAAGARAAGRAASVHLKIDTGMTRGGAVLPDWPALVHHAVELTRHGRIRVRGIWTHLARADEPHALGSVAEQLARFARGVDLARAAGLRPELLHTANSAAILATPDAHFDLTRAGISLYGPEPVDGQVNGLRPAMTVTARVVETGDGTATFPLGLGHGVPAHAVGRAAVLLAGRRCPVLDVSADRTSVDVTGLAVGPGDIGVFFGTGTFGAPTAAEWATWCGTNPHEILTGFGTRVPRRYLREGTTQHG